MQIRRLEKNSGSKRVDLLMSDMSDSEIIDSVLDTQKEDSDSKTDDSLNDEHENKISFEEILAACRWKFLEQQTLILEQEIMTIYNIQKKL